MIAWINSRTATARPQVESNLKLLPIDHKLSIRGFCTENLQWTQSCDRDPKKWIEVFIFLHRERLEINVRVVDGQLNLIDHGEFERIPEARTRTRQLHRESHDQ